MWLKRRGAPLPSELSKGRAHNVFVKGPFFYWMCCCHLMLKSVGIISIWMLCLWQVTNGKRDNCIAVYRLNSRADHKASHCLFSEASDAVRGCILCGHSDLGDGDFVMFQVWALCFWLDSKCVGAEFCEISWQFYCHPRRVGVGHRWPCD